MLFPHRVSLHKHSGPPPSLQPRSPTYAKSFANVPAFVQPDGFKDRNTWLGHMQEEPWSVFLGPRDDLEAGDRLVWRALTLEVVAVMNVMGHHLKCICKRLRI